MGSLTRGTDARPDIAYVRLTEYRWWVHLWSESDGNIEIQFDEFPAARYISYIEKVGEGSLALYLFKNDQGSSAVGGYRVANSELTLKLSGDLTFVGEKCRAR